MIRGFLLAAALLFAGCSASKQYFSPEQSVPFAQKPIGTSKASEFTLLGDGQFRYESSPDGRLTITGAQSSRSVQLDAQALSIAVRGNLAAFVDAKNTVVLYDLAEQSTIFSQNFGPSFGVIYPLAAPQFSGDLVIVPTLDGKLAVLNYQRPALVRVIRVGLNEQFSNVIYLHTSESKMLALSASKAITISDNRPFSLLKSFKTAASDDERIYLFTSAGEVLKTDYHLQTLASAHFEYANFLAAKLHEDLLYVLELSGKLLKLRSEDLSVVQIYDFGEQIASRSGFVDDKLLINSKIYPLP